MISDAEVQTAIANFTSTVNGGFCHRPRVVLAPVDRVAARRMLLAIVREMDALERPASTAPSLFGSLAKDKVAAHLLSACMNDYYAFQAPTSIEHTFEVFRVAEECCLEGRRVAKLLLLRHWMFEEFAVHRLIRQLSFPENRGFLTFQAPVAVHMFALWAELLRDPHWKKTYSGAAYAESMSDLSAAILKAIADDPAKYENEECVRVLAAVHAPAPQCRLAVLMLSKLRPMKIAEVCGEDALEGLIYACRRNQRNLAVLEKIVAAIMNKSDYTKQQWRDEKDAAMACE